MTLFLQFEIGSEGYLLEAERLSCVLPVLQFKSIPQAPPGVAGVCSYRGQPIPVIDLSELALGVSAARNLSTRLILLPFCARESSREPGHARLLGLIAQNATQMIRIDPASFAAAGISSDTAPYFGPVAAVGGRLLQWVDVGRLLPRPVAEALFRSVGEAI